MPRKVKVSEKVPDVHPWWVWFDEPCRGLFSHGVGEDSAVGAAFVGMHMVADPQPTDQEGTTWWPMDDVEYVVVDVGFMKSLMSAVRRTGLHGHYREAGTEKEYRF